MEMKTTSFLVVSDQLMESCVVGCENERGNKDEETMGSELTNH